MIDLRTWMLQDTNRLIVPHQLIDKMRSNKSAATGDKNHLESPLRKIFGELVKMYRQEVGKKAR